ncbi:ATP-binding protein [Rhizobium ruizarguesonis]|uniref:ATP-binding protein n=1 Tax=Rhizobium ruizarguesonis TaxID=2081791 RepID=UPI001031E778|nr:ATP-binding protein [Rhizobium ruizarguesonis]TAZ68217.1 ATP-binding protein [Rhizobium ruizarguesonis]TAZ92247.1 ATP-binding protein [Rhizobium ruizarguesonis]
MYYYLGTEAAPVPFGGRHAELAALDRWIDDPGQNQHCLVTGGPGRGKTALIVRWLANPPSRYEVVFAPASIRFGSDTAEYFFGALATRLAQIAGKDVGVNFGDQGRFYQGQAISFIEYLGKTDKLILLVLDGLDELEDWFDYDKLLPLALPSNIRVLCSARLLVGDAGPEGWMRRLRWNRLEIPPVNVELAPLARSDVLEALNAGGIGSDPSVGQNLATELDRLTAGDPLLLSFYLRELAERTATGADLRPEQLKARSAGLDGYMRGWLEEQKAIFLRVDANSFSTLERALLILACAHGPMTKTMLEQLMAELPQAGLVLSFATLLSPIRRFLIGSGTARDGYVLSHPRIATYLLSSMFEESAARAAREAFAAWGTRQIVAQTADCAKSNSIPDYLFRFQARHLTDAAAPPKLYEPLIEAPWLALRLQRDRGLRGFAADAEAALAASSACDPSQLAVRLRCLLILSSIRSIAQSGHTAAGQFADGGTLDAADLSEHMFLAKLAAPSEHVAAIIGLLPQVSEDLVEELAGEAISTCRAVTDASERYSLLRDLIAALPRDSRAAAVTEALAAARESDPRDRCLNLIELSDLVEGNRINLQGEALDLLELASDDEKEMTLRFATPTLIEGLSRRVFAIALSIASDEKRGHTIAHLSQYLPSDLLPKASEAMLEALYGARNTTLEFLSAVGERIASESIDRALTIAVDVQNDLWRSYFLGSLVDQVPESLVEKFICVANTIHPPFDRAPALAPLAARFPLESHRPILQALQALVETIDPKDGFYGDSMLQHLLVPVISKSLQRSVLDRVREMHDDRKAEWLLALAPTLPSDLLGQALELVATIDDPHQRLRSLRFLSSSIDSKLADRFADIAYRQHDPLETRNALAKVAKKLSVDHANLLLEPLFDIAGRVGEDDQKEERLATTLYSIVAGNKALSPTLSHSFLKAASAIRNPIVRSRLLRRQLRRLDLTVEASAIGSIRDALRECLQGGDFSDPMELIFAIEMLPARDMEELEATVNKLEDGPVRNWILDTIVAHSANSASANRTSDVDDSNAGSTISAPSPINAATSPEPPPMPPIVLPAIGDATEFSRTLAAFLPFMNNDDAVAAADTATELALSESDPAARALSLLQLALSLPDRSTSLLEEAVNAARKIDSSPYERGNALAALSVFAPTDASISLLLESFADAIRCFKHSEENARRLISALTPYIPADVFHNVFELLGDTEEKTKALAMFYMGSYLPPESEFDAMLFIRTIKDEQHRRDFADAGLNSARSAWRWASQTALKSRIPSTGQQANSRTRTDPWWRFWTRKNSTTVHPPEPITPDEVQTVLFQQGWRKPWPPRGRSDLILRLPGKWHITKNTNANRLIYGLDIMIDEEQLDKFLDQAVGSNREEILIGLAKNIGALHRIGGSALVAAIARSVVDVAKCLP